jgi:hypothetical protein
MATSLSVFAALLLASQAPAAAPSATTNGSKVWLGRSAEFEEYLKSAAVDRITDVPIGVTRPRRAYFKPGGLVQSAIVKDLRPGLKSGYWESYKSEIAAYELDKLLGLEMVPVTIEKRVEGNLMSAQLWVENCKWLKERRAAGERAPDVEAWNRQVHRQRIFDNLIGNIDRNEGNLLVDPTWNLILVDHSRAFTSTNKMPFEAQMKKIDRPVFERIKALELTTLKARVGPWVMGDGELKALLKRRDRIVAHFEKLAAQQGEAEVFIP